MSESSDSVEFQVKDVIRDVSKLLEKEVDIMGPKKYDSTLFSLFLVLDPILAGRERPFQKDIEDFMDYRILYGKNAANHYINQAILIANPLNTTDRENLRTLFKTIADLDNIMAAKIRIYRRFDRNNSLDLYKTYSVDSLKREIFDEKKGGRKLTRRRKSNPKSKSKHYNKNKRRSCKKSSYRRRMH
jgi:hypothetical protein